MLWSGAALCVWAMTCCCSVSSAPTWPRRSGLWTAASCRVTASTRVSDRHRRPADHRGAAGPERAVHLLRRGERYQGRCGCLQRHHPNQPAPAAPLEPTEDPYSLFATMPPPTDSPTSERPLPPPPAPLLPHSKLLSPRNMEAMYLSLITILGALCVVLTVVLVYVGFCLRVGNRGKYSLRAAAAAAYPNSKRHNRNRKQMRGSSHMELKTISSHCNGNGVCNGVSKQHNGGFQDGGFLQIVPGEAHSSPNNEPPPPAPPLPPTPQLPSPECDFPNGLSATLPSVLRRMNGNSYVLLRQSDSENTSPHCYSFADELNKILEKRKHTQLLPRPDESSV